MPWLIILGAPHARRGGPVAHLASPGLYRFAMVCRTSSGGCVLAGSADAPGATGAGAKTARACWRQRTRPGTRSAGGSWWPGSTGRGRCIRALCLWQSADQAVLSATGGSPFIVHSLSNAATISAEVAVHTVKRRGSLTRAAAPPADARRTRYKKCQRHHRRSGNGLHQSTTLGRIHRSPLTATKSTLKFYEATRSRWRSDLRRDPTFPQFAFILRRSSTIPSSPWPHRP